MGRKAKSVLDYMVENVNATIQEVADATGASYNYVWKLKNNKYIADCIDKEEVVESPKKVQRADILDIAKEYVTKDRANTHGDMENNFRTIAAMWSVYLGYNVSPEDVATMMTLLKVARIKSNPSNMDNWVDACGYMACGGEVACNSGG